MSEVIATTWTVAQKAPLSMGFSRQDYYSGLPCPPRGGSFQSMDHTQVYHVAGRFFTFCATREAQEYWSG